VAISCTVQKFRPSSNLGVKGQRSRSPGTKKTAESSQLTIHSRACATALYAARSSRLYHCVAAGGDRVTAVHADGGFRERSSGVLRPSILRQWENQRMLSSYIIADANRR